MTAPYTRFHTVKGIGGRVIVFGQNVFLTYHDRFVAQILNIMDAPDL